MMRTMLSRAAMAVVLTAAAAGAQAKGGELPRRASAPPPAPVTPARRVGAGIAAAPAPPQSAPAAAPLYAPPVYYVPAGGYVLTGAPYVGLSDGSVLVNFGNGYERVLRPCAPAAPQTPADPWARDALGRIPDPPGIAAIKAGGRGQTYGAMPGRNVAACYRLDASGKPLVVNY